MPEDVTKALDRAEAMVYDVNQRRVTDSTSKIEDLLGLNLDRLEQLYGRGDAITGVPTGYVDLDELLSGLQPSTLVVVGARPSMGKCVAWDTPIVDPATGELRTAADAASRRGLAGRARSSVPGAGATAASCVRLATPARSSTTGASRSTACARARAARSAPPPATRSSRPAAGARWPIWRPASASACRRRSRSSVTTALPIDEVVMLAHLVGGAGQRRARAPAVDRQPRGRHRHRAPAAPASGSGRSTARCPAAPARGTSAPSRHARRPGRPPRHRRAAGRSAGAARRCSGCRATSWRGSSTGRSGRRRGVAPGAATSRAGWSSTLRSPGLAHDLQHLLLRFGVVRRPCAESVVAVDDATWVAHELVVDEAPQLVALARRDRAARPRGRAGCVVAHARWRRPTSASASCSAGAAAGRTGHRPAAASAPPRRAGDRACARRPSLLGRGRGHRATTATSRSTTSPIPEWHNFVAADVFVHNTSFALGMAAHAALHANQPVLVFSLEMGSLELSPAPAVRRGPHRLQPGCAPAGSARTTGAASARPSAGWPPRPIWIDDNPNLTVMEIRAKARRLQEPGRRPRAWSSSTTSSS